MHNPCFIFCSFNTESSTVQNHSKAKLEICIWNSTCCSKFHCWGLKNMEIGQYVKVKVRKSQSWNLHTKLYTWFKFQSYRLMTYFLNPCDQSEDYQKIFWPSFMIVGQQCGLSCSQMFPLIWSSDPHYELNVTQIWIWTKSNQLNILARFHYDKVNKPGLWTVHKISLWSKLMT